MGVLSRVRGLVGGSQEAVEAREREDWRERNRDRIIEPSELDSGLEALAQRLREEGIALARFEELFGSRSPFDDAAASAQQTYERHRVEGAARSFDDKSFLTSLLPTEFDASDPFVRIALHPNVLAVANRYLGMRSLLRTIELWLTETTPGPAVETQLWHRDGDDVMNLKLFVYLSDVTRDAGPFCYAPGTHPLGSRRSLPDRDAKGRSTDVQVAGVVPETDWVVCTGVRGTIVLADTCGYHKQLKPEGGERLVLMIQYTSGTPNYPRTTTIAGVGEATLNDDQRAALHA